MSSEACKYVKKYSTYRDSTFWVHYLLAEIANRTNDYQVYVPRKRMLEEWPVCLRTLDHGIATLLADGYLTVIAPKTPHTPVRYQFIFKGAEELRAPLVKGHKS